MSSGEMTRSLHAAQLKLLRERIKELERLNGLLHDANEQSTQTIEVLRESVATLLKQNHDLRNRLTSTTLERDYALTLTKGGTLPNDGP